MKISVIIPCYNEVITIKQVIEKFTKYLPEAEINVFDNNSRDNSIKLAKEVGAIVIEVNYQGKGEVVRRAFSDIDSDIVVDADMQYYILEIKKHIQYLLNRKLDMLNISSKIVDEDVHINGYIFGNDILIDFISMLFVKKFYDVLNREDSNIIHKLKTICVNYIYFYNNSKYKKLKPILQIAA